MSSSNNFAQRAAPALRALVEAHARTAPAPDPNSTSPGKPHHRLVPDDEVRAAFQAAGIPAPNGMTVFSCDAGPSAVTAEAEMTTVSMSHGGAAHVAEAHEVVAHDDGTISFHGKELLSPIAYPPAIGGIATNVPEGGVMALVPVNPRFIDGSRVAQFLAAYDQFCLVHVTFEYVQATNLTQSGQLLMAFVNDPDDAITLETGFGAVRDAYSRAGSTLFSVRENARASLGHPLAKWYYTSSDAGGTPSVELPGFIAIFNMLPVTSGAAAVPLGTLCMTYEIRVRAPAVHSPVPATHLTSSASLGFPGPVSVDYPVGEAASATSLPANLITVGSINWGTIAAIDDAGTGALWRTWNRLSVATSYVLGVGNVVFWRAEANIAGPQLTFYPTLAAALSGDANQSWYFAAVAAAAPTRGFKLWNIMGADIPN